MTSREAGSLHPLHPRFSSFSGRVRQNFRQDSDLNPLLDADRNLAVNVARLARHLRQVQRGCSGVIAGPGKPRNQDTSRCHRRQNRRGPAGALSKPVDVARDCGSPEPTYANPSCRILRAQVDQPDRTYNWWPFTDIGKYRGFVTSGCVRNRGLFPRFDKGETQRSHLCKPKALSLPQGQGFSIRLLRCGTFLASANLASADPTSSQLPLDQCPPRQDLVGLPLRLGRSSSDASCGG